MPTSSTAFGAGDAPETTPDLVAAIGTDGQLAYARSADLDAAAPGGEIILYTQDGDATGSVLTVS